MAKTLARSSAERRRVYASLLQKRLFLTNSTSGVTSPPPLPSYLIARRAAPAISAACRFLYDPTRFMAIRSRSDLAGDESECLPMKSGSNFSSRESTEMAPLFPGCDYEHWLIVMDKPGGEGATKQQMMDCYVQTLAEVLGSEEEAKKKIYNVSFERYFGFGCEIDEETSNKFRGTPGILFVLPDSYVDAEYKDYGAELFVDGEIVQRSPERQRRMEQFTTHNSSDRPKYHDRTRYARRRDSSR